MSELVAVGWLMLHFKTYQSVKIKWKRMGFPWSWKLTCNCPIYLCPHYQKKKSHLKGEIVKTCTHSKPDTKMKTCCPQDMAQAVQIKINSRKRPPESYTCKAWIKDMIGRKVFALMEREKVEPHVLTITFLLCSSSVCMFGHVSNVTYHINPSTLQLVLIEDIQSFSTNVSLLQIYESP